MANFKCSWGTDSLSSQKHCGQIHRHHQRKRKQVFRFNLLTTSCHHKTIAQTVRKWLTFGRSGGTRLDKKSSRKQSTVAAKFWLLCDLADRPRGSQRIIIKALFICHLELASGVFGEIWKDFTHLMSWNTWHTNTGFYSFQLMGAHGENIKEERCSDISVCLGMHAL